MSAIEDVLAKPIWPSIDVQTQELVLQLLEPLCLRGTNETFRVGFNDTMQSIEESKAKVLFVVRGDLSPAECMPLALCSASKQIPLVTLPKGSKEKLGSGVCSLCSSEDTSLLRAVEKVGSAKLDWVYQGARAIPKKKAQKTN